MQGRGVDVGDVHRHLGDAIFFDVPADGLAAPEQAGDPAAVGALAALLPHVAGDLGGQLRGSGIEVEVDGDEEVARADVGGAAAGGPFVPAAAEVRPLVRVGHPGLQALVFADAAHREVLPLRPIGSRFIAETGDAELPEHPLREPARHGGALGERDPGHGDQREHVDGARAPGGVDDVPGAIRTTPQVHDGLVSMRALFAVAAVCAAIGVVVCKLVGLSGPAIFLGALIGVACAFVFARIREGVS